MVFNEKLMELRKKKGLSQEELGYDLGVSRQTVSKWELGETTPEMSKLVAMSELFKVSIDSMARGEEYTDRVGRTGGGYEYKSQATINDMPVIHINIGKGTRRAKGIIAIGNVATGVVAIGGLSVGVVSLGGFGIGIVTLGGLAAGLIALGGVAFGYMAIGGVALGYLAMGGVAFGINASGGVAMARDIAFGEYAQGTVAIGRQVHGDATIIRGSDVAATEGAFRQAVKEYLPNVKEWVVSFFSRVIVDWR